MKKISVLARLTLFAVSFLMWSSNVFSQSKIPVESITTDWSLFQEVEGVKFYVKKEVVSSKGRLDIDYVVIKLENTTDKNLTLSYKLVINYDLGCNGCNSDEYLKTLIIPTNSTIEGNLREGNSPTAMILYDPNAKEVWNPKSILVQNLIIK
jgi:hypothetical protein